MSKRMLIVTSVLAIVLATALPAYAQEPAGGGNGGFFGGIASFFNGLFHPQNNEQTQNQVQGYKSEIMPSGQPMPSRMMYPLPSGQPNFMSMQEYRLYGLVRAGKITQAQAQAIIVELQKVQAELKAWAQAQGIDESYVLGGGPMMRTGVSQGQATSPFGNSQGQGGQGQIQQYMQRKPGMREGQSMKPPQWGGQQQPSQPQNQY